MTDLEKFKNLLNELNVGFLQNESTLMINEDHLLEWGSELFLEFNEIDGSLIGFKTL